jgi:hypothetical protein
LANLFARASAVAALGLCLMLPASAGVKPGGSVPAFTGTTIAGKPFKSTQYKGKVLLLNFFSRY